MDGWVQMEEQQMVFLCKLWDSQESYHNGHVMIVRGAFPRTVADPNFNEAAMDTNTLRYNVIAVFVFNGSGRRHRDS